VPSSSTSAPPTTSQPTGGVVQLRGSSIAVFRNARIASFRHEVDDSEMRSDLPQVPAHVRWSSALLDRVAR